MPKVEYGTNELYTNSNVTSSYTSHSTLLRYHWPNIKHTCYINLNSKVRNKSDLNKIVSNAHTYAWIYIQYGCKYSQTKADSLHSNLIFMRTFWQKKTSSTSFFFNKAVSFLLLTSSHWAKAFLIVLFMVCSLFISAQFRLLEQEVVVKITHSCVILHSIHCQHKSLLICPKQLQYRKETSRDKFWSHKCTQGKKLHYQFRCQVKYLKVYISVLKSAFLVDYAL